MAYEYASLYFDTREEHWMLKSVGEEEDAGYSWETIKILNRLGGEGWRVIHVNKKSYLLERKIR